MVTFQVNDMTCGHCTGTINRAIASVDKTATVEFDIPRRLVRISGTTPAAELAQVIQEAGYMPQQVQNVPAAQPGGPRPSGSCCGGGRKTAPAGVGHGAAQAAPSCCS